MAKGGWLTCVRIRNRQDVELQEKTDHIYRLLKRNDRKRKDLETNEAWNDHDADEVVSGRRRR